MKINFQKVYISILIGYLVYFSCACVNTTSLQSCLTLCDPMDYSLSYHVLRPWDSPGKNTGVSCHAFLQGIFPTQESNPGLLHSCSSKWGHCYWHHLLHICCVVQSLSHVQLWDSMDCSSKASLSFTISWSLFKLMFSDLVMQSNRLVLCHPLLLLPSIFPSIRVFSNEPALPIRWPQYWSFSFTICHKGGIICISGVLGLSPGNLDSDLCFIQPGILHDVLCVYVKAGWQYIALRYSFPNFESVHCFMSGSNCCFLTCIQISQEAGQVVWYSHLF